jgi:hypothetical protein
MQEWTDQERETVRKLANRLQDDATFTEADMAVIREMIGVYRGVAALGRLARVAVVSLAAVAAAVTAWEVLSAKVRAWLGG